MENYIQQRNNTAAQYIATRLILNLCELVERERGAWVGMWWWEKAGIDLAGARETATAEAEADEDGLEE